MLGEPEAAPLGRFTYDPATDRWTWSEEVFALHGFLAGEVVPSTSLARSHQHPDDRTAIEALARDALESGHARGAQHRIVDAAGHERHVVVIVDPRRTGTGCVIDGMVLDVTVPHARSSAAQANAMLEAATAARTVIDQAKGALMLAHGVPADAAFETLRWYSQQTNLRLRTLAERVVEATASGLLPADVRHRVDDALHAATVGSPRAAVVAAAEPADGLTTEEVRLPGATFVRVSGEVDMLTAPDLAATLAEATAHTRPPAPVVVDLSQVAHLGRAGLAELLACHRRCRQAGTQLRVVVGPDGPALPTGEHGLDVFADLATAAA
jgi:anti-anti-sigma factor